MKRLENICKYAILFIWGNVIFYLTLLSMQGTSDNEKVRTSYHVYFIPDNVWKHIILLIIFIAACMLIKWVTINHDEIGRLNYSRIIKGLFAVYITVGVGYVLCTQLEPFTDQWHLIETACQRNASRGFLELFK